jgi:hypothetical protein
MKTTLLTVFLALFCLLGSVSESQAQAARYISRSNGLWNSPSTWTAISLNGAIISPFPAPEANNDVVIAHDVRLNINYDVSGDNGALIITEAGSLSHTGQFTLVVGDQRGNAQQRITVAARTDLAMNLYKIEFIKARGTIAAPLTTASCMTVGNQSDLFVPTTLTINGNLVVPQGNAAANGLDGGGGARSIIRVRGRLDGNPNALRNFVFVNVQIQNNPEVSQDCDVLVPLPVELISFDAKYNNSQVVLRWATASEKNALNFAVERSLDGKNYSSVTIVPAAGNSSTRRDYEATDRGMRNGLNYYRLKQTDVDGTFTYSPVVPVQVGNDAQPQRLEAYGDQGNLNIVLQMPGTVQQLRVLDMMGRVLYTESLPEGATGLVTRSVPMGSENRVYMVQAVTSEGVVSKKFATMR